MTKQQAQNLKIVARVVGVALVKLYAVGASAAAAGMLLRWAFGG